MSIYATLWTLKFPKEGDDHLGCEWITVMAQAVPAHIGSPTPGNGYENGDPFATFLPSAVETDVEGNALFHRAAAIVTEHSIKGTERSGQKYVSPLLMLTGEEYARMSFEELHGRICDALRGNHSPVVAEVLEREEWLEIPGPMSNRRLATNTEKQQLEKISPVVP